MEPCYSQYKCQLVDLSLTCRWTKCVNCRWIGVSRFWYLGCLAHPPLNLTCPGPSHPFQIISIVMDHCWVTTVMCLSQQIKYLLQEPLNKIGDIQVTFDMMDSKGQSPAHLLLLMRPGLGTVGIGREQGQLKQSFQL